MIGSRCATRLPRLLWPAAWTVLLTACPALADAPGDLVYVSPPPGARYVQPLTELLLRAAVPYRQSPEFLSAGLHVLGARSGPHLATIEVTRDACLLRVRFADPFVRGERVSVTLGPPLAASATYGFEIAAERVSLWGNTSLRGGAPSDDPVEWRPRLIGGVQPTAAEADTTPPVLVTSRLGTPAPGQLYLAPFRPGVDAPGFVQQVDDNGRVLAQRSLVAAGYDFKPQPGGILSFYDGVMQKFYLLDASFALLDSVDCREGYVADVHELRLLPDGHALLLSYDPERVDMREFVAGGDSEAVVIGAVVQELDAERNLVFEWRSWDHFSIADATHLNLRAHRIDYVHANAIEVADDGNLLLSSRHMDEITKIDRMTGSVLWRWGGRHNEFTFLGDTLQFSHQHAIRQLANGHYTLFDNGNFHVPPFSRAVEYELDEPRRTARAVWQYRATPDIYGLAMGYVQRLPNGNTLISWGTGKPDIVEVDGAGRPVWTATLPTGVVSYRAFRFVSPPAADSLGGAPTRPAATLTVGRATPFARSADLFVTLAESGPVDFRVFDVRGRVVRTLLGGEPQGAGILRVHLDLGGEPAGVYLCRVQTPGGVTTRKLVIGG